MGSINCFLYINIIIFNRMLYVNSGVNDFKLFPNLPVGEYKINFKAIVKCDTSPDNKMHHNLYFSKLSTNKVALKGNITYEITLDDSLTFHTNFAIKDSVGGWKDNAHIISLNKACTSWKKYLGEIWTNLTKEFAFIDQSCPVRPGTFVSSKHGYDLTYLVEKSNLPKIFFYGTYKCRLYFEDIHNVQHGCINFIIEIKRPWETD